MKKAMLVLLSVLMVVTCVLTLTACQEDCDKLGHEWGEWETTTDPTCTANGVKSRTCSRCQEVETDTVAALGHDWGAWTLVDGTVAEDCGNSGSYVRECSRCDATDTKTEPATGKHTWVDDTDEERAGEIIEPTCNEPGAKPVKCSVCGATDTQEVPATGEHTLTGNVTGGVPATCGTEGRLAAEQCSVCELYFDAEGNLLGESEEDLVIPATGVHNFEGVEITPAKDASCTEAGNVAYQQCQDCQRYCDENGDVIGEGTLEDTVIEMLPHTYDKYEAVPDTFTHKVLCSVCDNEQGTVACTGEWTTTSDGHSRSCELCGNEETSGHVYATTGTYLAGQEMHSVKCTIDGCDATVEEACTKTSTCPVCKHIYVPATKWIVVGDTNNTSWKDSTTDTKFIFVYDHETATYNLEFTFASLDVFQIKKNTAGDWSGQMGGDKITNVTFAEGIDEVDDLFTKTGDCIVKYDCTVVITLHATLTNSTPTSISIHVTDVTTKEITAYNYTFHVYNAAGWSAISLYLWDNLSTGSWPGIAMEADDELGAGWFKATVTVYESKTGTKQKMILNNNGGGTQLDFDGTTTQITLAEHMYFRNNTTTQFDSAEAAHPTTASVALAVQVAVVPVKFELAA